MKERYEWVETTVVTLRGEEKCQRATLTFTDYLKPGDSLALVLDLGNNRPVAAKVSTFLDSKADAVTLDVQFSALDNNATYASRTTLNAPTKNLSVSVENSGYRPR